MIYSFRHTMLTRLGEAGADAFAIQKIAGHASIRTSRDMFIRLQRKSSSRSVNSRSTTPRRKRS